MPTTTRPLVAVVSALVTLDPATPGTTRRSVGEYLRLAGPLLDLDVPLVVYVDDDAVAEWLLVERERRMPGTPTVVRPADRPPEADHDRSLLSQHLEQRRPACATSASKDSAHYLLVGWTKPWWLRRAADEIDAARYRWIDFGLHHTAPFPVELDSILRRDPGRRHPASLHVMTPIRGGTLPTWSERRIVDLALGSAAGRDPNWWWDAVPLVAGGTFDVAVDALDWLVATMRGVADEAHHDRAAVTEEVLLTKVLARSRDRCRVTHSSFATMLDDLVDADVPSLDEHAPSTRFVDLPGPTRDDRAAFNPSIAADPDGGYRCIVRHANYRYVEGRYETLDGSDAIVTENALLTLDGGLQVTARHMVDDRLARTVPPRSSVHGLEDLRLFRHDGRWWGSATIREHRDDARCEIAVVELDGPTVVRSFVVPSPVAGRHEKNWTPLHDAIGPMTFLWSVDPPVALRIDDVLGAVTVDRPVTPEPGPSAARGGSQAIPVAGGWLTVVHQVRHLDDRGVERREYRHRFVVLDDEVAVAARSPEFVFLSSGIEFCAGLAPTPDGVVLSFGVEDRTAHLVTISWADVEALVGRTLAPGGYGA